ncbi:MAG TPA: 23S rRNA (adenine(2030)-N(6))-methyltransferase RlmJ [Methylibium sp.]
MFSYRHGFHAGNHADVLKHLVLVQLLQHLLKKDKPLWVIDTHAGGGGYDLTAGYATKNAEFETGIGVLWERDDWPAAVADYLTQVRALNADGALRFYPGSPQIAAQMLREHDPLRAYELHPTESRLLSAHFDDEAQPHALSRRVSVQASDGFTGLKAALPPPSRRALVLIDPPYEDKADYRKVTTALKDALKRFATGVYAVWYPQVQLTESREFPAQLQRLAQQAGTGWLHASLTVKNPVPGGHGLHGSGIFVFNPAWTLSDALREALPYLLEVLGQDEGADFELRYSKD